MSEFFNISNEVGLVKSVSSFFIPFAHTPTVAQPRCLLGRALRRNSRVVFFLSNLRARFVSLHQLRCCPPDISPITCDHDDVFELPAIEEAGSLFT